MLGRALTAVYNGGQWGIHVQEQLLANWTGHCAKCSVCLEQSAAGERNGGPGETLWEGTEESLATSSNARPICSLTIADLSSRVVWLICFIRQITASLIWVVSGPNGQIASPPPFRRSLGPPIAEVMRRQSRLYYTHPGAVGRRRSTHSGSV